MEKLIMHNRKIYRAKSGHAQLGIPKLFIQKLLDKTDTVDIMFSNDGVKKQIIIASKIIDKEAIEI